MISIIPHDELSKSDLIVDAVYAGGHSGNTGDDPISKTLKGAGNQGGFRAAGVGQDKKFVVLYTRGEDRDWPDTLDLNTGQFIYYGDNKTPGHELHDTGPGGNRILRRVFDLLHSSAASRSLIPPFFFSRNIQRQLAGVLFNLRDWPCQDSVVCLSRQIWSLYGKHLKGSGFKTIEPSLQCSTFQLSHARGSTKFQMVRMRQHQRRMLGANGF
jgi:hypothetical protein